MNRRDLLRTAAAAVALPVTTGVEHPRRRCHVDVRVDRGPDGRAQAALEVDGRRALDLPFDDRARTVWVDADGHVSSAG